MGGGLASRQMMHAPPAAMRRENALTILQRPRRKKNGEVVLATTSRIKKGKKRELWLATSRDARFRECNVIPRSCGGFWRTWRNLNSRDAAPDDNQHLGAQLSLQSTQ
jgi:hypothetical protein